MSNMGLELALKQLGIPFARAKVGDRYVLEMMAAKGWRLGAENSGHVIILDKTTTGDGIVAGLQVLAAIVRNHMTLHDLCSGMKLLPQVLVNVRFAGNHDPLQTDSVKAVTAEVEAQLNGRGRSWSKCWLNARPSRANCKKPWPLPTARALPQRHLEQPLQGHDRRRNAQA